MENYKTPGVYVREISVFPPSVAQVETAIPAFIGYTERAHEHSPGDLHLKAKKVASLLEYRQYFGGEPPLNIATVQLGPNNALAEASVEPQYNLFHSLQLFSTNGGGDCYIISVGGYDASISIGDRSDPAASPGLDPGLAVLEAVDEPTMIVVPDAVLLSDAAEQYTLQKNALQQCNDLQDRVALFDLRESDTTDSTFDWEDGIGAFRDSIGTQFLKYGVAYTPHLRTSLPKDIKYRDFRNNGQDPGTTDQRFQRAGANIDLHALPGAKDLADEINLLGATTNDLDVVDNELAGTNNNIANAAPNNTLINRADAAYGYTTGDGASVGDVISFLHANAATNAASNAGFRNYVDFLYEIFVFADGWIFDVTSTNRPSASYQAEVQTTLLADLEANLGLLVSFDKGADTALTGSDMNRFVAAAGANVPTRIVGNANYASVDFSVDPTDAAAVAGSGPAGDVTPFTGGNDTDRRRNALPALHTIADGLLTTVNGLAGTARERYSAAEKAVAERLPAYTNLVRQLQTSLSTLPPSGAIAGVYAQVDANRGVWKAPANVSLNNVRDLTRQFTESQTDSLNVDDFGKSINAIKFFTGRGTLVWGARTLAGNDNEWRYISVRRFFNMVEESVKKSTMWAVFEPNDANTWIKVKGMIENFLTLQWRAGALQGAKPDDAFFVKIGLGETMNALDILEGRMIVEIGMAVVRPAEFIILRFMHKMVESG